MDIVGNNYLISIALKAKSPSQAAKLAQLAGFSKEQVRATRNASLLLRDKGLQEFNKIYQPYTEVDLNIHEFTNMKLYLKIDRYYESRGLNAAEYNKLAEMIETYVNNLGLKIKIEKKKTYTNIKSTI